MDSKARQVMVELVPLCVGSRRMVLLPCFLPQDKCSGQPWSRVGNYLCNKIRDVSSPPPPPPKGAHSLSQMICANGLLSLLFPVLLWFVSLLGSTTLAMWVQWKVTALVFILGYRGLLSVLTCSWGGFPRTVLCIQKKLHFWYQEGVLFKSSQPLHVVLLSCSM